MNEAREKALMAAVGAAIARERVAAGKTQDQVAEALGIGAEAVSRIERGLVMPSLVRLVDLAEVFGCPVERFVRRGSDRGADQAAVIGEMIAPLKKGDRQFVVEMVERVCGHLQGR